MIRAEEIARVRRALERLDVADQRVMRDWSQESLREYYTAAHLANRKLRANADRLLAAAERAEIYEEALRKIAHGNYYARERRDTAREALDRAGKAIGE